MDIDLELIKKLSLMARVDMDEQEMKEIGDTFGPILEYVGQVQKVSENDNGHQLEIGSVPFNILREDIITNQTGFYSDKIMIQAPATENGFLKVKQIL